MLGGKMAFPFKSEGIFGRPVSHRRARLSDVLRAKLSRLARGSRVQRELAERVQLVFDPLEPRFLLNADLNVNLATDGPQVDHEIIVRLVEEVQAVDGGSPLVTRNVQIIDQSNGGKVLAFGELSAIDSIAIAGGAGNDTLRIDEDSFGSYTLPKVVSFDGGGGNDSVVFDSSSNVAWTLNGTNAGSIDGQRVDVAFSNTENLRGADGNHDTFYIASAGKLSGMIDGGFGGKDTIVYSGVTASNAVLGANGSGVVALSNGAALSFENMEPFNVGAGVQVVDKSTEAAGNDVTIIGSGSNLQIQIGAGPAQTVAGNSAPVWLYLGEGAGQTSIVSLPGGAGFSLMVDAGDKLVVNDNLADVGHLGLSAAAINIGDLASISAQSIDLRAVDWARVSLAAAGGGDTLDATTTTSATVNITGALTATGALNVSSFVSNTVRAHGIADTSLRDINAKLDNTATVTLAGAALSGASVSVTADSAVVVDLMLTDVPIPNLLGLVEVAVPDDTWLKNDLGLPTDLIADIKADSPDGVFNTGSQAFSDALSRGQIAMQDLARIAEKFVGGFTNAQVSSDVTVTNETRVAIDAASTITQTGGTAGDAVVDVLIAARDDSRVAVTLQTEIDALIPATATIVVFSALDSDTLVTRTTEAIVGPATGEVVGPWQQAIDAEGDATVAAASATTTTVSTIKAMTSAMSTSQGASRKEKIAGTISTAAHSRR
jgi:hypothetical protein